MGFSYFAAIFTRKLKIGKLLFPPLDVSNKLVRLVLTNF